ncbi:MAG: hypothetical protein R3Y22_09815 [Bacteroidales bacterium]
MKKISILLGVMVILAIGSCSNDIVELPEGAVWGANGDIIEGNLDFTMAEFITDVDGEEWIEIGSFERFGTDSVASVDYFYGWDGGVGDIRYRFENGKIETFFLYKYCEIYFCNAVPADGKMLDEYTEDFEYYYYSEDYEIDNVDNSIFFAENTYMPIRGREPWTIVAYNSEYIAIDYTCIFSEGSAYEKSVDFRLVLKKEPLPDNMANANSFPEGYMTDIVEYFNKYDSEFVVDAENAYNENSIEDVMAVWCNYKAKIGL